MDPYRTRRRMQDVGRSCACATAKPRKNTPVSNILYRIRPLQSLRNRTPASYAMKAYMSTMNLARSGSRR